MIHLSLQMYHIPAEISSMLGTYFDGFCVRFTTKDFTTNWTRLEVGIAMRSSLTSTFCLINAAAS